MIVDVMLSLGIILVCIYLLAIISDSFFIVSLDRIAHELKLSDEVAGASLMAIGSSAPEISIALIALSQAGGAHSDIGIGAIVGSAVFNILVITGVAAIAANELRVQMFDVHRDVFYYLASIGYLLVIFWDGNVTLLEALAGLVAYAIYLVLLVMLKDPEDALIGDEEREPKPESPLYPTSTNNPFRHLQNFIIRGIRMVTGAPNENYLWTFFVAIVFIIGLSYALVEATLNFSEALKINPMVVALTLLAAGTSAPDLISSVDVAREGRGGMAVANAIGSDIFDVFVGLGLPWAITLIFIRPDIVVGTDGLWVSIGLLVGTVLVLYVFLWTERTLTKREGIVLLLLYAAYVVYTIAAG